MMYQYFDTTIKQWNECSLDVVSTFSYNIQTSRYHPTNWVFINQNTTLHFEPFYIPHDIKIYLIETQILQKTWHVHRLYYATGNILIKKHLSVGNMELNSFELKISAQPFPELTGKSFRFTAVSNAAKNKISAALTTLNNVVYQVPVFAITQQGPKKDAKQKRKGFNNEMIGILQRVINFTYIVEEPPDHLYGGIYQNNTPYGMLAKLYKNESDMGATLIQTKERATIIDFSSCVIQIQGKIVYRHIQEIKPRIFFYLEPFLAVIWTCITCLTLLIAVLLTFNKYIYKFIITKCNKPKNLLKSFTNYVINSFYTLLLTGVPVIVFNLSSNIILQVFHLFCLMMFTGYSSTLTSILTVSKVHIPFESLEELVFQTDYSVCITKGTPEEEIFRTSKLLSFTTGWGKIQSDPNKYLAKTREIGLDLVYRSKSALLSEEIMGSISLKGNCSYRFAKLPFYKATVGYIYRKEFIYKNILSVRESGTLQKISNDNLPAPHNEGCQDKILVKQLKLSIIIGLFLTLLGGIVISLLVFAIEICIYKYKFI
uniref:Ionotropic glutamate receptor C-terminal domain-containing protein n=1 Tax=Strigamia maritima TaxID=126957 RepID=T1JHE3_STRMM